MVKLGRRYMCRLPRSGRTVAPTGSWEPALDDPTVWAGLLTAGQPDVANELMVLGDVSLDQSERG